jgi:hypothetical protein
MVSLGEVAIVLLPVSRVLQQVVIHLLQIFNLLPLLVQLLEHIPVVRRPVHLVRNVFDSAEYLALGPTSHEVLVGAIGKDLVLARNLSVRPHLELRALGQLGDSTFGIGDLVPHRNGPLHDPVVQVARKDTLPIVCGCKKRSITVLN